MKSLRHVLFYALWVVAFSMTAQQLFTSNDPTAMQQMMLPRNLNYWPEGQDIVCIDGENRFTRALYGAGTAFRLETSDQLEFGLYMPYMGGNVTLTLPQRQVEARYRPGSRIYRVVLADSCRANRHRPATVTITAVALYAQDGALWRVESDNVRRGVRMNVAYGAANNASFSRNGDMGVDRKDCFDFSLDKCVDNEYKLARHSFTLDYGKNSKKGPRRIGGLWGSAIEARVLRHPHTAGKGPDQRDYVETLQLSLDLVKATPRRPQYFAIGVHKDFESLFGDVIASPDRLLGGLYDDASREAGRIASSLIVETPDPVLNTLGGAAAMAADAIWGNEDQVWLHGAIGWRNPLPGWRAAYVGDVLGWHQRARTHFDRYAASQLVDVPVNPDIPPMDSSRHLARGTERIGAPLYTTGYIGRYPANPTKVNHYDMNLVYIDELLWHFQWTGDEEYMRRLWPVLERHLEWEHRNFDPDDDGLYDAYCCIWASDALYYSGGAVTHSSAYNYRACRLAADVAARLGYAERAVHYAARAERILSAINSCLWMPQAGVWAEYRDGLGLKRLHPEPALWTVYHAIDSDVADSTQRRGAARYVRDRIPHFPIRVRTDSVGKYAMQQMPAACRSLAADIDTDSYATVSTTSWQPYAWSINNVALAEVAHTALALWQAGDADQAFRLYKSALIDGMYLGGSPGNLGQISHYDAARGECYRDFGDPVGITTRALVQGLFGIRPDRIHSRILIQPGIPVQWKECHLATSDCDLRLSTDPDGRRRWTVTLSDTFRADTLVLCGQTLATPQPGAYTVVVDGERPAVADGFHPNGGCDYRRDSSSNRTSDLQTAAMTSFLPVSIPFNLAIGELFHQQYLSPRYPYATLAMPTQGIGEWCHPLDTFHIDDVGLRAAGGRVSYDGRLLFLTPESGPNALIASQWDNFPDTVTVPLSGQADCLYMLMAGTTNAMQSRIENGKVCAVYADGGADTLSLVNPINWWPIEQELVSGLPSFYLLMPGDGDVEAPVRLSLRTGCFYRPSPERLNQPTDGGAATLLAMPLDGSRPLDHLEVIATSNDVLIGLLGVTLGLK